MRVVIFDCMLLLRLSAATLQLLLGVALAQWFAARVMQLHNSPHAAIQTGAPEHMSAGCLQILFAPDDAGFMQQFAAVSSMAKPEENLAEVINQLSGGREPNRVLCCGHSLGGALATLGVQCPA